MKKYIVTITYEVEASDADDAVNNTLDGVVLNTEVEDGE